MDYKVYGVWIKVKERAQDRMKPALLSILGNLEAIALA